MRCLNSVIKKSKVMELDILIPIVFFVSIVWVIERVTSRRALNREILKHLENGGSLDNLDLDKQSKIFQSHGLLKYGLISIGLSLGLLMGSYFEQHQILANEAVGYLFSISLFVGITLIIGYYLTEKANKKG